MRFSWTSLSANLPAGRRVAIVFATVLAVACDQPVGPASNSDYQLLFVNEQVGVPGQDIYRMNADGTGRENLTRLATVQFPTFQLAVTYRTLSLAPNGRTIAFESNREGCPGIWGMNTDGTGFKKLSIGEFQATRCNYYPYWSPDGSRIAFTTSREGKWSVYVMDDGGTNPRNVSSPLDQSGFNSPTGWSPDGRVVFMHPTAGARFQAYIVKPDGSELGTLFGRTGDHSPQWSPDGSKVAFIRDTDSGSSLFVMDADGTNLRRLTNHSGVDTFIAGDFPNDYSHWSPDGRRIVFDNEIGTKREIHVINADGTGHVKLTTSPADFNGWSPDGRITLSSNSTGSYDLYLINADGTGLVNLTNTSTSHETRALWVRGPY